MQFYNLLGHEQCSLNKNLILIYTCCFLKYDTGTAPCEFDEGAPLTQEANYGGIPENIVVGIMSKNKGCGDPSVPSIYTSLATYYSWLLQTAGQQPAPSRV